MEQPVTAVYDANILYPAPLRDLFIRLAQTGLVQARWTETIHDEWFRNVLKDNPQLSAERLARTRTLMNDAVRDCLVTGYEDLIDSLTFARPGRPCAGGCHPCRCRGHRDLQSERLPASVSVPLRHRGTAPG